MRSATAPLDVQRDRRPASPYLMDVISMTLPDYLRVGLIPDRWISDLLARHLERNPTTRHRPSLPAIRAVLNALAISHRPPDKQRHRALEPYTDETREQLAARTGFSAATVGDVLAVLEAHGWIRVIVRGGKHRGSCRALPILELLVEASADVLGGELPALMNGHLNGTNAQRNGTNAQRNGEPPVPPLVHPLHPIASEPPPPLNRGASRSEPSSDRPPTDDEIAQVALTLPEAMRAAYVAMAERLRAARLHRA